VFLALNGITLIVEDDDAVAWMLDIAAGEINEDAAEVWIRERIEPNG
jgi:prophage maintenance system killer protein